MVVTTDSTGHKTPISRKHAGVQPHISILKKASYGVNVKDREIKNIS